MTDETPPNRIDPSSTANTFREATIEDILANPHKFGAPTIEEYKRDPARYKIDHEFWFSAVDKGSTALGRHLKRIRHKIYGYKCKTLEEVESVAKNMGFKFTELKPQPDIIDQGGGWCDIIVNWVHPSRGENGKGEIIV